MNEITQTTNDISYIWSRFNPRWVLTGILSGVGAGFAAIALGAFFSTHYIYREAGFPFKLIGFSWVGPHALNAGVFNSGGLAGLLTHVALSAFFGFVFAQFVAEWMRKRVLILMGTLGGLAVWLFWSAMFMPSFNEAMTYLLPKPVSILLHLVFGLSFGLFIVTLRPLLCRQK